MIRFKRAKEPKFFQEKVRKPGLAWLKKHVDADRPIDYWKRCKRDLACAFRHLCAYSAMYTPGGTVDHFRSWNCCKREGKPEDAYDWNNFRYCAGWINSSKKDINDDELLDPYEVIDDWFEIDLPSLMLKLTDRIPKKYRSRAQFTLERLHLERDPRIMDQREEWLRMYKEGEITLDGLEKKAPLIARAIRKQDAAQAEFRPKD